MQNANFSQIDGVIPKEVIAPSLVSEIQNFLDHAVKKKLSVIPMGNGSKLSIGNPPAQIDFLLTMKKFDKIIDTKIVFLAQIELENLGHMLNRIFSCFLIGTVVIVRKGETNLIIGKMIQGLWGSHEEPHLPNHGHYKI